MPDDVLANLRPPGGWTHTDDQADVTERVGTLRSVGWVQRSGSSSGGLIQLTTNGRRRLADLERGAAHA